MCFWKPYQRQTEPIASMTQFSAICQSGYAAVCGMTSNNGQCHAYRINPPPTRPTQGLIR